MRCRGILKLNIQQLQSVRFKWKSLFVIGKVSIGFSFGKKCVLFRLREIWELLNKLMKRNHYNGQIVLNGRPGHNLHVWKTTEVWTTNSIWLHIDSIENLLIGSNRNTFE